MAWTQSFTDSLEKPAKVISYVLKFLASSKDYNMSPNADQISMSTEIALANADVTIDSVSVTPQRWSVNFGGFTVTVAGDLRPLMSFPRRGAVAELHMVRGRARS